jgi:polyhydroxyalkanoate synthase
MAGAFQLLRSNDLVWSRLVHEYLMGERPPMTDLMAWNADATRMPYRMHSEYLRGLFLDNDLAGDRYVAGGKPVALSDIRVPLFVVGAENDHVSPWRSVYKIHALTDTEVTFALASGGHNVGIVAPPGGEATHHRVATRRANDPYLDPDSWYAKAEAKPGTWWPAWFAWLDAHSGKRVAPPHIGSEARGLAPLADAPGQYVLGR